MTETTSRTQEPELAFEEHRVELRAYCYRMLGSTYEAEDAVQETLVRAWRAYDRFEGRAALRSWLYRIATNVCFDMLRGRRRRALPMDVTSEAWSAGKDVPPPLPEAPWLQPIPDGHVLPPHADPADVAEARESIRLAFVATLQHLPARQRAVLILREVLRWPAADVAELLETTVVSVNSALQRARATLASADVSPAAIVPLDPEHQALLERYVDAFERYDIESLVALLHEDVRLSMPPWDVWMRGRADAFAWFVGPGAACAGSFVVPLSANGQPAFAQYKPAEQPGRFEAWAIHVLDMSGGTIRAVDFFVDAGLFALFGLPRTVDRELDGAEAQ
jgi:RNA polymerase sigma-70 factor (ECF subfamily)